MRSTSEPFAAPSDGWNSRSRHDASAISASAYAVASPATAMAASSQQCSRSWRMRLRDPPDARMEEQQRFGDRLQQVDRVIAAADVRELVSEERFDLRGGHVRHRGERQHDQRLQPADQDRRVDHGRLDDPERHADAQAPGETFGGRLPGGERRRHGRGAQAMDPPASARRAWP